MKKWKKIPKEELNKLPDAEKLRLLADWFDMKDLKSNLILSTEVQDDLRRIANKLDGMKEEKAFLFKLKKEMDTAHFGEGINFNLPFISNMINERIIQLKKIKCKLKKT